MGGAVSMYRPKTAFTEPPKEKTVDASESIAIHNVVKVQSLTYSPPKPLPMPLDDISGVRKCLLYL